MGQPVLGLAAGRRKLLVELVVPLVVVYEDDESV
jgi:hypothetical protein